MFESICGYLRNKVGPINQVENREDHQLDTVNVSQENVKNITKDPTKHGKWRHFKNLFILCISFFLGFSAFQTIQTLQSSINAESGLGVISLALLNVGCVIGTFITPSYISYIGAKWSAATGLGFICIYAITNFYPTFYTLLPVSFIFGMCNGPLWLGQSLYLIHTAESYADLTLQSAEHVISLFYGIFYLAFNMSQVLGNLVSSFVLFKDELNTTQAMNSNLTCGSEFCGFERASNQVTPDKHILQLLLGIFVMFSVIAFLFFTVFADNNAKQKQKVNLSKTVIKIAQSYQDSKQILILPLCIWVGFSKSFIFVEFTQAFVTCQFGVRQVGFSMVCFGSASALTALISGKLQKLTGRIPLFIVSHLASIVILVLMITLKTKSFGIMITFILAALWGGADSTCASQLAAMIGVIFSHRKDTAYAAHRLWIALGYAAMASISSLLCTKQKISVALTICSVSLVSYIALEKTLSTKKIEDKDDDKKQSDKKCSVP